MRLTGQEIVGLAEMLGFTVTDIDDDNLETEIDIFENVTGCENDDGTVSKYQHVAFYAEYHEEGAYPLGDPVKTVPKDNIYELVTWRNPIGEFPDDWIEKQANIGDWLLKVWFSGAGFFEASLTHHETKERRRLDIGDLKELKIACDTAAKIAIKSITK